MNKTVLITGGCGFIGSHLADALLAAGYRVRILDNLSTGKRENVSGSCEIIVGDITDQQTVQKAMAGISACFHLAAIVSVPLSVSDWLGTHRVNLTGAIHIFDAARTSPDQQPIPVIYASSSAIYGDNPQLPLAESAPPAPLSAYGADKMGMELHARVATLTHGVPTLGFRFFNVYGPRQDPSSPYSGVISIFIDRIRKGEPLLIYGDGEQQRDFVYVGDVVEFLLKGWKKCQEKACHTGNPPEALNVCTGIGSTINSLAETLFSVMGQSTPIHHGPPRLGDILNSVGSADRGRQLLNFSSRVSLSEGLNKTVHFLNS
ncbi:MAG: SDR family NAD(P)-dependent oxidoreductase [Magnetococcales bacterium]|nr:SDR family NAD(P)-dependent oxidoreductase [Magnetococcales bacterium]